MLIAFQGETGAYSEEAVQALFAGSLPKPYPTFEAVFDALARSEVDLAVVPIENSLFGSVHVNLDLLQAHSVWIAGELSLRIRHHLMAQSGTAMADLRRVYSHPQALGQCQVFLRDHLPHAEPVPVYDTAGAARMIALSGEPAVAAIASRRAAGEYGLDILASGIETNHHNFTRFLVLSRERQLPETGGARDTPFKTSIVFAMQENVPGALFKSLAVFALRDLDLLKIESRPLVGRPGEYLFYLDVSGALTDAPLQRALDHLRELTTVMKVLGSYPVGRTEDGADSLGPPS